MSSRPYSNRLERMLTPADRAMTRRTHQGSRAAENNGSDVPCQVRMAASRYFDGTRMGGIDQLKNIRPSDVYSIRRINGVDAQARFGIGHSGGVLYVSSITQRAKSPN